MNYLYKFAKAGEDIDWLDKQIQHALDLTVSKEVSMPQEWNALAEQTRHENATTKQFVLLLALLSMEQMRKDVGLTFDQLQPLAQLVDKLIIGARDGPSTVQGLMYHVRHYCLHN